MRCFEKQASKIEKVCFYVKLVCSPVLPHGNGYIINHELFMFKKLS